MNDRYYMKMKVIETDNEIRYPEKRVRKYVIATLDIPTLYLQSLHHGVWQFIDNIENATKMRSKNLAYFMLECYRHDTEDNKTEMVVAPIDITYEIIQKKDGGVDAE